MHEYFSDARNDVKLSELTEFLKKWFSGREPGIIPIDKLAELLLDNFDIKRR